MGAEKTFKWSCFLKENKRSCTPKSKFSKGLDWSRKLNCWLPVKQTLKWVNCFPKLDVHVFKKMCANVNNVELLNK